MKSDELERTPRSCEEFRDRISATYDHEEDGADALRRHALVCAECRAFEDGLHDVTKDFAVLRGTPVADLWPALAARVGRPSRRYWIEFGTLAAGALATWSLLSWFARDGAASPGEAGSIVRALAAISTESSSRVELARMDGTPELRLLAHLGAVKEDDR